MKTSDFDVVDQSSVNDTSAHTTESRGFVDNSAARFQQSAVAVGKHPHVKSLGGLP